LFSPKFYTLNYWLLRIPKAAEIGVAIALFAALGVFLALSLYTWPSAADDLCLANYFEEYGVFGGLYGKYMLWSGGYSSIFLMGAVPQLGNFLGDYYLLYKFLPLTFVLLTVWASTALFRTILPASISAASCWLLGLGFTVLFLSSMPSVATGFYWFSSAAKYQGGNLLLVCQLLIFSRLVKSAAEPLRARTKGFVVAGICIAFGVGFSETQMVVFYALVTLMCFWRMSVEDKDSRVKWVWLGLFVWMNCFVAIYILAPGNSLRSEVEGLTAITPEIILDAIHASIIIGIEVIDEYLALPQLWWFSAIVVLMFLSAGSNNKSVFANSRVTKSRDIKSKARQGNKLHGGYIALGGLVCLLLPITLQFPSLLLLAVQPPLRIANAILFLFFLSWCVTLALLVRWVIEKYSGYIGRLFDTGISAGVVRAWMGAGLLVGFASHALASFNIQTAYSDLTEVAPEYNHFMYDRYQELNAAKDSGNLFVVSQYPNPPQTIHSLDIVSPDSGLDFTLCFSEYFGVGIQVIDDAGVIGEYIENPFNNEVKR
jgi:hypothetical protein